MCEEIERKARIKKLEHLMRAMRSREYGQGLELNTPEEKQFWMITKSWGMSMRVGSWGLRKIVGIMNMRDF